MFSTKIIIGNVISLIGYLIYWVLRYTSSKKRLIVADVEIQVSGMLSMAVLGTFSGILNSVIGLFRGVFALAIKNEKLKKIVFFVIMALYFLLLKDFSTNWTCALVVFASCLNTYSIYYCNADRQKLLNILICFLYGSFCFAVQNYTAGIFEWGTIIATVISYIKFKGQNNK